MTELSMASAVRFLMVLGLTCGSVLGTYAQQQRVPGKPKILVVHSAYCAHCRDWLKQVYANFHQEAKEYGVSDVPEVDLLDVADAQGYAKLQDMVAKKRLQSIPDGVPAFILVDSEGNEQHSSEGEACRIVGYSSRAVWFLDLIEQLNLCYSADSATK